jgi:predicted secreted protein
MLSCADLRSALIRLANDAGASSFAQDVCKEVSAKRRRWSASTERNKAKPAGEPSLTSKRKTIEELNCANANEGKPYVLMM